MNPKDAALQIICGFDNRWKDIMKMRISTPQLLILGAVTAFEQQREDVYTKVVRHALLEQQKEFTNPVFTTLRGRSAVFSLSSLSA